ncbi:DUF1697 domain-containing protein [Nocardioides sp. cx-173]|uniref:DUF1697 domain-containing protein n=1 Tax=Nocardioides sp. cx-173 TaxID=2898796 RepID=UPI001E2ACA2A|nr:DUF1697 domain-containing protein [Nocardioides sp. cx-173]MCD4527025.1 DUF1697 domain-containing protein [Nocardioides sp. cx-173]UGB41042.1 DUF1697 domain-containing protein [Nocardioides sp. cx-173]
MATYVAFLRAINLGANRKFPKAAIVAATEAAGFGDVETYINTGNVRFGTAMRSRARIEAALEQAYRESQGFEVPTILFTPAELRRVADDADRLAADHAGRHYVSLLKDEPSAATARVLEERSTEQERVHVEGRAVHLLVGQSYLGASTNNVAVERLLGVATNRNVTVIRALREKWC